MAQDSKLSKYHAKRDFTKTAEPRGQSSPTTGKRLRFVIQKHDATRLHYDLRLELDGVFKSWAVTRGPSLDPHDKRLAVEVEDHPLDYGDFEGTIPKGQYGGGTVMLWDRGYWEPEGNETPEEALAKGDFKFTLEGERLHGSWVLVRMKNDRTGGKRTNWLLIKHRDELPSRRQWRRNPRRERHLGRVGPHDGGDRCRQGARAETVHAGRSGRSRPTRCGTATHGRAAEERRQAPARAERRRRVRPHAASDPPRFHPAAALRALARPPAGADWVHEIKFDGYRIQLRVKTARRR